MIEPADSLLSPARREVLRGSAATLAAIGLASAGLGTSRAGQAAAANRKRFPEGFIWGTATAGHQVEGNDVNSDMWFLEQLQPTLFAERVGDANNSLELWPVDLDLVRSLSLNAYRFSLEWSRIEPEPGQFSLAMLDHYLRIIEGCRTRGLQPLVSFNHFATPRWFAARGGWTRPLKWSQSHRSRHPLMHQRSNTQRSAEVRRVVHTALSMTDAPSRRPGQPFQRGPSCGPKR